MKSMRTIFLCGLIASGCQTQGNSSGGGVSPALTAPVARAIAGDMTNRLVEVTGAADKVTIVMPLAKGEYSTALRSALKERGYSIIEKPSPDPDGKTVKLAYAIGDGDGNVLAQLTAGGVAVTRMYRVTGASVDPASPVAVMRGQ